MAALNGATDSLTLMAFCVLLLRVSTELILLETARLRTEQTCCTILNTLSLAVKDL